MGTGWRWKLQDTDTYFVQAWHFNTNMPFDDKQGKWLRKKTLAEKQLKLFIDTQGILCVISGFWWELQPQHDVVWTHGVSETGSNVIHVIKGHLQIEGHKLTKNFSKNIKSCTFLQNQLTYTFQTFDKITATCTLFT